MKKIVLQCLLKLLCSFCLLFLSGCKEKKIVENDEPTPTDSISVLLDVTVINSKEVIVEATFCNKLDVTVGVLKREILYNKWMNWGAFSVMRGNKEIKYIGLRLYKINEHEHKENLYNLIPGGSYTARIKLHNEYDLSRSGTYTVTYRGYWRLPDEEGNDDLFYVRSNTVEFKLKKGIQYYLVREQAY
ncbi:MAG TPA: hypothetical protein DIU00_15410, partial [Phycisphaerales bacterium]|nr:hypothetical protein [Phycisphaerales bacterium]